MLIAKADLDFSVTRRGQNLSSDQLTRAETFDELGELMFVRQFQRAGPQPETAERWRERRRENAVTSCRAASSGVDATWPTAIATGLQPACRSLCSSDAEAFGCVDVVERRFLRSVENRSVCLKRFSNGFLFSPRRFDVTVTQIRRAVGLFR